MSQIRLNLGSGYLPLPDYINVDIFTGEPNFGIDLVHDITKLKEVYKDGTVDEIFSKDTLEHIGWRVVMKVIQDWVDLLKPGGVLKIRVPDTDKLMQSYMDNRDKQETDIRQFFGRTIQLIFGNQDFNENTHLGGFKASILCEDLEKMGMRIAQPVWFDGGRDLRITAIKGTAEPLVSLDHPDYKYKTFSHAGWRVEFFKLRNDSTNILGN
jgi:predicted SAM-dependent methyltransferase